MVNCALVDPLSPIESNRLAARGEPLLLQLLPLCRCASAPSRPGRAGCLPAGRIAVAEMRSLDRQPSTPHPARGTQAGCLLSPFFLFRSICLPGGGGAAISPPYRPVCGGCRGQRKVGPTALFRRRRPPSATGQPSRACRMAALPCRAQRAQREHHPTRPTLIMIRIFSHTGPRPPCRDLKLKSCRSAWQGTALRCVASRPVCDGGIALFPLLPRGATRGLGLASA